MRKTKFIVLLTIGSLLTFGLSGCKDYDSEISDLQSQIDLVSSNLNDLKTKFPSKIATAVENSGKGLKVSFSDGTSYTYTPTEPTAPEGAVWKEGTLWVGGINTGIPESVKDGDSGNPEPGPSTGNPYVLAEETATGYKFTEYDAEGKVVEGKTFEIPKAVGSGGITSIVFMPEFTLDGKPAIYATAISIDTTAGSWASSGTATDTIYGALKLKFKLNGATNVDKVQIYGTSLAELRAGSYEHSLGEYNIGTENVSVEGNVLNITVPQAILDTFSVQRPAGQDLAPYLAVVVNGSVVSSYIPYVQDVIPSSSIKIGERRESGKFVEYGFLLTSPQADHKDPVFQDSITVLDPNSREAIVEPVLFYQKTATKALVLRGFEKWLEFSFKLETGIQILPSSVDTIGYGQTVYGLKDITKQSATVYIPKASNNDSIFSAGRDYVGVKVKFDLSKAVTSTAGRAQLIKTLSDSTDNAAKVTKYIDERWGNALVKVFGEKYFMGAKDKPTQKTLYQGADTIVDAAGSRGGVILAEKLLLDTAELRKSIGGASIDGTGGSFNLLAARFLELKNSDGIEIVDADTAKIIFMHPSGASVSNPDATKANRLIVQNTTKPGKYTLRWGVEHPEIKGITFVADFELTVNNPKVQLGKKSEAWENDGKLFAIYGDTIYDRRTAGGVSAAADRNDGQWLMARSLWDAVDTLENAAAFDYSAGAPTCGVPFSDAILDVPAHWTFSLESFSDHGKITGASLTHWNTDSIATGATGSDTLLVLGTNGKGNDKNTLVEKQTPIKVKVVASDAVSGQTFETYVGNDKEGKGVFEAAFKNPLQIEQRVKPLEHPANISSAAQTTLKEKLVGETFIITNTQTEENIVYTGSTRNGGNSVVKYFTKGVKAEYGMGSGELNLYGPAFSWSVGSLPEGSPVLVGTYSLKNTLTTTWGQEIPVTIALKVNPDE